LVVAWAGFIVARRLPTDSHTYGWQRGSILAALANALLLLVAVGGLAWGAVGRIISPAPIAGMTVIWVAGAGVVINTVTALLFLRGSRDDLNIRGAFLHMAADALVSAGVVVAGALTLWMGWTWLDPVVSLAIAAVILWGTWDLFKQSLHMLFDGVPAHIDPEAVHDCLAALPGVTQVHDLHIWAMGTAHVALTAHLVMPQGQADDAFLHEATELMHDRFEITHVTLQVVKVPFTPSCVPAPEVAKSTQAESCPV
jgi:cobalt-zinc-cadmium efflux system protein